jgi:hypothetical protein
MPAARDRLPLNTASADSEDTLSRHGKKSEEALCGALCHRDYRKMRARRCRDPTIDAGRRQPSTWCNRPTRAFVLGLDAFDAL